MEEDIARGRVSIARRLMAEGKTAAHAAKTVGWSKACLYRLVYGEEPLPKGVRGPQTGPGPSRYVPREALPARDAGTAKDRLSIARTH